MESKFNLNLEAVSRLSGGMLWRGSYHRVAHIVKELNGLVSAFVSTDPRGARLLVKFLSSTEKIVGREFVLKLDYFIRLFLIHPVQVHFSMSSLLSPTVLLWLDIQ